MLARWVFVFVARDRDDFLELESHGYGLSCERPM